MVEYREYLSEIAEFLLHAGVTHRPKNTRLIYYIICLESRRNEIAAANFVDAEACLIIPGHSSDVYKFGN